MIRWDLQATLVFHALKTILTWLADVQHRHPTAVKFVFVMFASSVMPYLLLIKFPFSAYVHNSQDIVFYKDDAYIYFISFLILTFIFSLFAWFSRRAIGKLYVKIGITFVIVKIIYDCIYANLWVEDIRLLTALLGLEIVLPAMLLLALRKLDQDKLVKVAFITYLLLIPLDMRTFGPLISDLTVRAAKADADSTDEATGGKGKPNVYHLVLDGFSPYLMRKTLRKTDLEERLPGFVFFTNAKANYGRTALSVPSMISGTLHDHYEGLNFADWYTKAMRDSVSERLTNAKIPHVYFTWMEAFYKNTTCKNHYTYCDFTQARYRSLDEENVSDTLLPLDLALFTYLPASIRYMLWRDRKGTGRPDEIIEMPFEISNLFADTESKFLINNNEIWSRDRHMQSYTYNSFLDFLAWDKKHSKDGQYAYIHLLHPHGPYTRDENCALNPLKNNWDGVQRQHQCSVKIIEQFVEHIKKINRYETSTIIINSDHGCVDGGVLPDAEKWDVHFNSESRLDAELLFKGQWEHKNDGNVSARKSSQIEVRAGSLLMVKPAGADSVSMKTSLFNAQLYDIFPTILENYGLDASDRKGTSLLDTPPHNKTHPRQQIFHAVNNNNPFLARELQRFERTFGGWKLHGEKVLVNEKL